MSAPFVMALDAGTGAGRCAIFDMEGRLAGLSYREWRFDLSADAAGGLEFRPSYLWTKMAAACREVLTTTPVRPADIAAVSVTSQRLGMVLLDRSGKEILGIPNVDRRARDEARQLGEAYGRHIYRTTGRWPGPGHPLCKLKWLKHHQPEHARRAGHVLAINDWLLYRLSGELACEPTNAAETCLFDVRTGTWTTPLMYETDLDPALFPTVYPCGSNAGSVSARAALATGLLKGTPVVIGGGDTQCGVLGTGTHRNRDAAVVAGSSAPVEMLTDAPMFDRQYRTLVNPFLLPQTWVVESNAMLTGASFRWLRDILLPSANSYDALTREAAEAPPGAGGVLAFLGTSIMDTRRGSFSPASGIMMPTTAFTAGIISRGCLARATLEAIAYAIRANIEQIADVVGRGPRTLSACGGSMKSALMRHILADVTNRTVRVSSSEETTALGAAMCAAVGAGLHRDLRAAARAMSGKSVLVRASRRHREAYDTAFRRWSHTFQHLRKWVPS